MITYIGCEMAREMLDPFVDGELPVDEQVALEAHLRWCRACSTRVEDMQLIGTAMRVGPLPSVQEPSVDANADEQALAALRAGVLMRIRTEHEQSFEMRFRGLFQDMRLFWPAIGATTAVIICMFGVFSVMRQLATEEQPESLAAMIESIANPGSERNPLRLNDRISIPRMIDRTAAFDGIPQDDAVFAVATVVTRDGRVAGYELLQPDGRLVEGQSPLARDTQVAALLDAVRRTRFAPATEHGRPVAVNMVWLILRTTASGDAHLEELLKATPRIRPLVPSPPAVPERNTTQGVARTPSTA